MGSSPDWDLRACAVCRQQWMTGGVGLRELRVDVELHQALYRCDVCGPFWIETERAAFPVDRVRVHADFGEDELHGEP